MSGEHEFLTPDVRFHLIRKMERHKVMALAGPALLPHEQKYLEFHNVAGVILFRRNVESLSQAGELIAQVTEHLPADSAPPLIMADHEGDFVAELRDIIGVPPAPLAIAATGDTALGRDVALETGRAMRKLGMNAVLAPVADCFHDIASPITGLRTFGSDPERVGEFVAASIAGFAEAGLAACAKHFPGHGATAEDSHETLPEVKIDRDTLMTRELLPFRSAIDAGVDMMMMSHVAYPLDDGELVPASFDRRLIGGLLRKTLGFGGVVITDALEMAGARWYASSRFGGLGGGFERSLLAGADLMLYSRPVPEQVRVENESTPVMSLNVMETIIKTLEKVVDRGRIDEKLAEAAEGSESLRNILGILEGSYDRVVALRNRLEVRDAAPAPPSGGNVIELGAYPTVPTVYRDVAERSIVATGAWSSFVPVVRERRMVVMPVVWTPNESLMRHDLAAFLEVLSRHFPEWRRTPNAVDFSPGEAGDAVPRFERGGARVVDASRYPGDEGGDVSIGPDEDLVILFSSRGAPNEAFAAGLQSFADACGPALVLVVGWPITDWIPDGTPGLVTLGASTQVASALAEVLTGRAEPAGSLDGLLPAAGAR